MKKIMFNDKYGLTEAVLKGCKTQTRRILNPTILFERLETYDEWGKEDVAEWKRSCVKRLYAAEGEKLKAMLDYALTHSSYNVGEKVAIAQSYETITQKEDWVGKLLREDKAGWKNKMFVKAYLMPNHIRINKVRIERLQDISEDDCLSEGIKEIYGTSSDGLDEFCGYTFLPDASPSPAHCYCKAQEAYAALVDKLYGKGTWESNPYVYVYEFNNKY